MRRVGRKRTRASRSDGGADDDYDQRGHKRKDNEEGKTRKRREKTSASMASEGNTATAEGEGSCTRRGKVSRKKAVPYVKSWLCSYVVECASGSLLKRELFEAYLLFCMDRGLEPTNDATFGRIVNSVFTNVQQRRLRRDSHAKKWHYCGIAYKPPRSPIAALEEGRGSPPSSSKSSSSTSYSSFAYPAPPYLQPPGSVLPPGYYSSPPLGGHFHDSAYGYPLQAVTSQPPPRQHYPPLPPQQHSSTLFPFPPDVTPSSSSSSSSPSSSLRPLPFPTPSYGLSNHQQHAGPSNPPHPLGLPSSYYPPAGASDHRHPFSASPPHVSGGGGVSVSWQYPPLPPLVSSSPSSWSHQATSSSFPPYDRGSSVRVEEEGREQERGNSGLSEVEGSRAERYVWLRNVDHSLPFVTQLRDPGGAERQPLLREGSVQLHLPSAHPQRGPPHQSDEGW